MGFNGGTNNQCQQQEGSLAVVHCTASGQQAPSQCACRESVCICLPTVSSCSEAQFAGRPTFEVYLTGCTKGPVLKTGLHVGTSPGLSNMVSGGELAGVCIKCCARRLAVGCCPARRLAAGCCACLRCCLVPLVVVLLCGVCCLMLRCLQVHLLEASWALCQQDRTI